MKQEFVMLPREVVEQAMNSLRLGVAMYQNGGTAGLTINEAINALRAALDQPQNHVPDAVNMVPAGWRLVPVEPTEKMVDMGRGLSSFPNGVYRAMLSAAPQPPTTEDSSVVQPQADQPAMTPIAQRKLEDLVASGYTISGYSIYHERKHQHGFVTGAGLVGWWKPDGMEYPQPQGEQEPIFWYRPRIDGLYEGPLHKSQIERVRKESGGWVPLYTNQQPKREPLTDEQILGFGPGQEDAEWTYEDQLYFARAIENAHNIK